MTYSQEAFTSVVQNAIDFLQTSINELQERPKYSAINFCAAVELFLKARLLLEHWALIIEEPNKATQLGFKNGDFKSVSMEQAIIRLKNIANVTISRNGQNSFNRLREHRNKLIHFYHPGYSGNLDDLVLEEIASEQCEAWYYLELLLSKKWKDEFRDFQNEVSDLHRKMLGHKAYLNVKYDQIRDDIEKGKSRGINFSSCLFCNYEAAREEPIADPVVTMECLVCENQYNSIHTACPECQEKIKVFDMGEGTCTNCGTKIDIDFLLNRYGVRLSPKDSLITDTHAYCVTCEFIGIPTVIPYDEGWLCLYCFEIYDSDDVRHCDRCGEFVTGEAADYWDFGCVRCSNPQRPFSWFI